MLMIEKRVELAKLTTIHIKGQVDIKVIENLDDFSKLPESFTVFGNGSNLLVKNRNRHFYKLSDKFSYVRMEDNALICGASLKISTLMQFLIENSISGFEFMAGVPATVGGAVFMNAGAFFESIGDKILYAKVFCASRGIVVFEKDKLNFGYRCSNLNNCVVIEAGFLYNRVDKNFIKEKIANNIKTRLAKAHLTNTFGSVFKNPLGDYAGRLIEESGLKGFTKNSAKISDKHANYILGSKQTDVDDVLFLIDRAKEMVFKNFGVELEEEVKIV